MKTLLFLFVALTGLTNAAPQARGDIHSTMRRLDRDIKALETIIETQAATIEELALIIEDLLAEAGRDPIDPPVRPDPPIIIDPPVVPPIRGMEAAPKRVDPERPTRSRVDVHVYPGRYELNGRFHTGMARDAYAAVDKAMVGEGVIVLGIHGDVGRVSLGHAYSKWSDDKFEDKDAIGIQVSFVGLDHQAAVGPVFLGSRPEDADTFDVCDTASFFNLGIKGETGTYAFRQHGWIREMIWDQVWVKPHPSISMYLSAFNFHKGWDALTFKAYEPRGLALGEHVAYIKHGGFTQVLDCNLWGGRRTGFQARPHELGSGGPSPKPHGAFIADGNYATGFGWNHVAESGGQWITVWTSLEFPVRISNNTLIDGRYGALGLSKGIDSSGPYLTDDGFSHTEVYIWGNKFENKRAKRACVSLTDIRDSINFGEANLFVGPTIGSHTMTFGNQWAYKNSGAIQPRVWKFWNELPTWPVHEYVPVLDEYLLLNEEDLRNN